MNKVLDPLHIGFTIDKNLHCSLKTCTRRDKTEGTGIIGKKEGKYTCMDYNLLSDQLKGEKESDGVTFKHRYCHILMFMVTSKFLLRTANAHRELNKSYHKAFRKI